MSQSMLRTLLSEACCILCWGFTLSFLHFTAAFYFLCFLPIAPYHRSFFSFLPLLIFSFHPSLSFLLLKLPRFFSLYSLPLVLYLLFLFCIFRGKLVELKSHKPGSNACSSTYPRKSDQLAPALSPPIHNG